MSMSESHKAQKEHARRQAEGDGNMSQEEQKRRAMEESIKHTTCEPNEGLYS
jgi:hypothetical protein